MNSFVDAESAKAAFKELGKQQQRLVALQQAQLLIPADALSNRTISVEVRALQHKLYEMAIKLLSTPVDALQDDMRREIQDLLISLCSDYTAHTQQAFGKLAEKFRVARDVGRDIPLNLCGDDADNKRKSERATAGG